MKKEIELNADLIRPLIKEGLLVIDIDFDSYYKRLQEQQLLDCINRPVSLDFEPIRKYTIAKVIYENC